MHDDDLSDAELLNSVRAELVLIDDEQAIADLHARCAADPAPDRRVRACLTAVQERRGSRAGLRVASRSGTAGAMYQRYGTMAPPMNVGGDVNSTRLDTPTSGVDVGSLIHSVWSGSHTHSHHSGDGPDDDQDGIHSHWHTHDGDAEHSAHDHEDVDELGDDSVYTEAQEAGGVNSTSSSGRRGYGQGRQMEAAALLLPSDMAPGATLNERLTAAERLVEATSADWDESRRTMLEWRALVPDFDLAHSRMLNPDQRHAWVQTMNAEAACQAADRAHQRAKENLARLAAQWDAVSRPDLGLPPGSEPDEWIGIRGNRSLFGGSDGRTVTRTFESPVGLGGRDGHLSEPTRGDLA